MAGELTDAICCCFMFALELRNRFWRDFPPHFLLVPLDIAPLSPADLPKPIIPGAQESEKKIGFRVQNASCVGLQKIPTICSGHQAKGLSSFCILSCSAVLHKELEGPWRDLSAGPGSTAHPQGELPP